MDRERVTYLFGPDVLDVIDDYDLTDEADRMELVEEYLALPPHALQRSDRMAVLSVVVAQVLQDDPPEMWQTIDRLRSLGMERDATWENGIPPEAVVPHAAEFIRMMVKVLSRRASDWYPPCSAEEIYANLYFGNPVILHVHSGDAVSHVIVVAGIRPTDERGRFEVLLNDPSPHVPGPFWARYDAIHPAVIQHMVVYKDIRL